jgi:hypothetical protein
MFDSIIFEFEHISVLCTRRNIYYLVSENGNLDMLLGSKDGFDWIERDFIMKIEFVSVESLMAFGYEECDIEIAISSIRTLISLA